MSEGDFDQGFSVVLQIGEERNHALPVASSTLPPMVDRGISYRPFAEVTGRLPANPDLLTCYQRWQQLYQRLGMRSRLGAPTQQETNVSLTKDFERSTDEFGDRFNQWLTADPFRPIRETWLEHLSPSEPIRVILQTPDPWLRRFPWHVWDVLQRYAQAEIALSAPVYQYVSHPVALAPQVRILAILGNSQGIDVEADRRILEQLPQAQVEFVVEPDRQTLTDLLWNHTWDILFFAGHSTSQDENIGRIFINQTDSLTIEKLRYALQQSVNRGLQIAMFNSCDGLGLAKDLADLHIPQMIVMREPVPDRVAQTFLKYFLASYARGQTFYLAMREARERLQGMEDRFPCATWLPVICQNPAVSPPLWNDLLRHNPPPKPDLPTLRADRSASVPLPLRRAWIPLMGMSVLLTGLLTGVRTLGWLQPLELAALDQMVRWQPAEPLDSRLILITLDERDRQQYGNPPETSITNESLLQLLQTLNGYHPRVIGLDIYRPKALDPSDPVQAELAEQMEHMPQFIAICKDGSTYGSTLGIQPPPHLTAEQIGFSDLLLDSGNAVRRQLLLIRPDATSPCPADQTFDQPVLFSFSFRLAQQYLAAEGISPTLNSRNILQLGNVTFPYVRSHFGGYQGINAAGRQLLLYYHSSDYPATRVSLTEVLEHRVNPEAFRDRIVLIGVTDPTVNDTWESPYGSLPGVVLHAHMVSQVLSAVLDDRPLLWALPIWGDALWIEAWVVLGAIASLLVRPPQQLGLTLAGLGLGASGLCVILFWTHGVWLPWVPCLGAIALSALVVRTSRIFWVIPPRQIPLAND
jgi:CHASE2 domain-containing sensor protein